MEQKELNAILEAHLKWLRYEDGGIRANFRKADLRGANLCGADLRGANLCGANLCGADLYGADLYGADLRRAVFWEADLRGADLREANLRGADFYEADLCGANLCGANLCGANLRGAGLTNARGVPPIACPETGSFIGYKKALVYDSEGGFVTIIVKLQVEEDALRSSATTRKCRCSKATILSAEYDNGSTVQPGVAIHSTWKKEFGYHVGDTVVIEDFDTNRWIECAPGFHFFITKQEAIEY